MDARMWIVTALLVSAACPRASTPTRGLEILEPPTGEGCDQMRSCCEAMLLLEPGLELACQLSSARGGDCMEMIETTTAIYQGLTQQAPPALCGALPGR